MAEEEAAATTTLGAQVLGGPVFIDDASMEDLIDKLKLLNYEVDFCQAAKPPFKPLNRTFFSVLSDNPNAQFFYFTSVAAWLMNLCGNKFATPGQFDDPNGTAASIIYEVKQMELPAKDLAPNKLRQGHGDAVLQILVLLADKALLSKAFGFRLPQYPTSDAVQEEEGEVAAGEGVGGGDPEAEVDDHIGFNSDSEDEIYTGAVFGKIQRTSQPESGDNDLIVPQVTAEAWSMEVERVAPQLHHRNEGASDWRSRVEGATTLLKATDKMYPDVKSMMERLSDEVTSAVDKIAKREQSLSTQFHEHVEEYRGKLRDLNATQDNLKQTSENVAALTAELNQVSETLEQIKNEIQEREDKISDSSPLMQIKKAVAQVRGEIKEMSLRIGVLQHTVLHLTMKQSKNGITSKALQDTSADFELGLM